MRKTIQTLLLTSLLFHAFHAYGAEVVTDTNIVRDTTQVFCVSYVGESNKVALLYPTQQGLQYVGSVDSGNTQQCTDLSSLATEFQDPENIPWGEGLEVVVGNTDVNPNFLNDCINLGQADGCAETIAGFVDRYSILRLRQTNSILGAQGGTEYLASLASTVGQTIDDFYPVATAVLGLLVAFLLLGYLIKMWEYDDQLLEKTKKLSKEVDEHIERTTESYKAWNRRLGNLFRE